MAREVFSSLVTNDHQIAYDGGYLEPTQLLRKPNLTCAILLAREREAKRLMACGVPALARFDKRNPAQRLAFLHQKSIYTVFNK